MKLSKKLLTILPLSIGVISPIAISTSCNKSSLTVNFADSTNSLTKGDKQICKYWEPSKYKDACKEHIQVVEGTGVEPLKWQNNTIVQQQFYWDLVYSCGHYGIGCMIKWTLVEGSSQLLKEGQYWNNENSDPITFTSIVVERKDNKYWINLVDTAGTSHDVCQSYTYSLI